MHTEFSGKLLCIQFIRYNVKTRYNICTGVQLYKVFKMSPFRKTPRIMFCMLSKNSVSLARKRIIPAERQPLVGEVTAKFCG
jgi:hypothetical protein